VLGEDLVGPMVETRLLRIDQAPNRRDHRGGYPGDWHLRRLMKSLISRRRYSSHPQITILQNDRRARAGVSGFRSDLVSDVCQSVETQLGRSVYQRRSDLSRALSTSVGFTSTEECDTTTPEGRYTRWNGLSWTNLSVSTIVEEIVAKPDSERIGELVELLESTVELGDEQHPGHVEPSA
jgi:hypothetical protein